MAYAGCICNRSSKPGGIILKTGCHKHLLIRPVAHHHLGDGRAPQRPLHFKPVCTFLPLIRRPEKLVHIRPEIKRINLIYAQQRRPYRAAKGRGGCSGCRGRTTQRGIQQHCGCKLTRPFQPGAQPQPVCRVCMHVEPLSAGPQYSPSESLRHNPPFCISYPCKHGFFKQCSFDFKFIHCDLP
jgi:hypothetical protein